MIADGRIQVLGVIGKGGYGEVLRVFDLESSSFKALKIHQTPLNSCIERVKLMLDREIQVQHEIYHPNIVKLLEVIHLKADFKDNRATLQELCTGPNLRTFLKEKGPLQEDEALHLIYQVFDGLAHLSRLPQKIIHWDLKPENLLFDRRTLKICDFGLCSLMKYSEEDIALSVSFKGTLFYSAPETTDRSAKVCPKLDIWACGIILFEMLYGHRPFFHEQKLSQKDYHAKLKEPHKLKLVFPNTRILSQSCDQLIRNCLETKPRARWSADKALEHLNAEFKSVGRDTF